jgi:uncharacterized protein YcbX
VISVKSCTIYPVKSLSGVAVDRVLLTARGFAGDRLYMLVDEQREPVTQRTHPGLEAIVTTLDRETLYFAANALPLLEMTSDDISDRTLNLSMKSGPCAAPLAAPRINDWFSAYLDQPVRLVRLPDDAGDDMNFANRMPLLITTAPSLNALRPHFQAAVDMKIFRPNIVLDGNPPFAEDIKRHVRIGGAEI